MSELEQYYKFLLTVDPLIRDPRQATDIGITMKQAVNFKQCLFEECERELCNTSTPYIMIACKTCGVPWEEHQESCTQHNNKSKYEIIRKVAMNIEKYNRLFEFIRANGWIDPDAEDTANFRDILARTS